jgi:antitoxin CptB
MNEDEHQAWRKKLMWRASHRGIKEMDIIVGGFANARLPHMSETQLQEFERILDIPDQELLAWMTTTEQIPADHCSEMLTNLLAFRPA